MKSSQHILIEVTHQINMWTRDEINRQEGFLLGWVSSICLYFCYVRAKDIRTLKVDIAELFPLVGNKLYSQESLDVRL